MTHTGLPKNSDPAAWIVFAVLSHVLLETSDASPLSDEKWLLEQLNLSIPTTATVSPAPVPKPTTRPPPPLRTATATATTTVSRIKSTPPPTIRQTVRQTVRPPPAAKTVNTSNNKSQQPTPHSLKTPGFISRFALNLIKQKRFDKVYIHMSRACRKYQDDPFALKDLQIDETTMKDLLTNATRCGLCCKQ